LISKKSTITDELKARRYRASIERRAPGFFSGFGLGLMFVENIFGKSLM
jgi:hypothetical protein